MAKLIVSENTDPYKNLALENMLYESFDGEPVLYLWQNEKTVVIGRWQNAFKEINLEKAKELGIRVARRTTGGGAVYHDLGNLNFTFILSAEEYNIERQLGIIASGARAFGIDAVATGRNDLTVNGLKFSGNAFKASKDTKLHHGTVLISADSSVMSSVLNASPLKLKAKGVDSVKSRVVNLKSLNDKIDVSAFGVELVRAFRNEYGAVTRVNVPENEYNDLHIKYSSDKWIFGENPPFDYVIDGRYSFGEISVNLCVTQGKIFKAKVYTDSLDLHLSPVIENALLGVPFRRQDVSVALESAFFTPEELRDFCSRIPV